MTQRAQAPETHALTLLGSTLCLGGMSGGLGEAATVPPWALPLSVLLMDSIPREHAPVPGVRRGEAEAHEAWTAMGGVSGS